MKEHHQAYLNRYLATLSENQCAQINQVVAEYFCADEFNANTCAQLVLNGKKTATCSLHAAYEIDEEDRPEVGRLMIVLDWQEYPVCIVETTEIETIPFNKVTEAFAYAEGEGDRSYEHWKRAHIAFFEVVCKELGLDWNEQRLITCERFRVVHC